jgi:hypothetical protein
MLDTRVREKLMNIGQKPQLLILRFPGIHTHAQSRPLSLGTFLSN